MKKSKMVISLFLTAVMVLTLAACGGGQNSGQSGGSQSVDRGISSPSTDESKPVYDYKISHIESEEDLFHIGYLYLKDLLEESGRFRVTIYSAGSFSSNEVEAANQVMEGVIQQTHNPGYTFATATGLTEYYLYDYPYMFESNEEYMAVATSDIAKEIAEKAAKQTGLHVATPWVNGWMGIGTKVQVSQFSELESLKLRTPTAPLMLKAMEGLKISAIPMAVSEVYTGLQQGTIDGVVTTARAFYTARFYEVASYFMMDRNSATLQFPLVNLNYYNSLDDEARQILDEALEKYAEYMGQMCYDMENDCVNILGEKGATVTMISDDQKAQFIETGKKVLEENKDLVGEEIVDRALEIIQQVRGS